MRIDIKEWRDSHYDKKIKSFLNDYAKKFYLNKKYLYDSSYWPGYIYDQLIKLRQKNLKNQVVLAFHEGKIQGILALEYLGWDTEYFGIPMSRIKFIFASGNYFRQFKVKNDLLRYIFLIAVERNIKFCSIKVDSFDFSSIHVLEKAGFLLMSTCNTYAFKRVKFLSSYGFKEINGAKVSLDDSERGRERIEKMNPQTVYSHFMADKRIEQSKAKDLYLQWVKNYKNLGLEMWLLERKSEILGFALFEEDSYFSKYSDERLGEWVLAFIKPRYRNKYNHFFLTRATRNKFSEGISTIKMITQVENIKAYKRWLELGAVFIESKYVFHKWID